MSGGDRSGGLQNASRTLAAAPPASGLTPSRRSRAAPRGNATQNVGALFRLAAGYYAPEHLEGRSGPRTFANCTVPSAGPVRAIPGVSAASADFGSDASLGALGFDTDAPVRHGVETVAVEGCGHAAATDLYSIRAHGDLDGDGVTSLLELAAGSSTTNELMRTPGFYVVRAEE